MKELTYELIKPIIVKEELGQHNMIQLEFKTEDMDSPIATVAVVIPDQDELVKQAMQSAGKSAVANMAISGVAGMMGGLAGQAANGASGMITGAVAGNPVDILNQKASQEKRQAAIVTAFSALASFFDYNEQEKKWVKKQ